MHGDLVVESWLVVIGLAITLAYFVWPSQPYLMGAIVFVAAPLFLVAGVRYAWHVVKELRARRVL